MNSLWLRYLDILCLGLYSQKYAILRW